MVGSNTTNPYALSHNDQMVLYLDLMLILFVAKLLGELARKLKQPTVMGELLAGIFLGKTVLGTISPSAYNFLFGARPSTVALSGVTSLCVTMYMLVAGLEMNLKNAMKKKIPALSVGFFSLAIPFMMGFLCAYYQPEVFGAPKNFNQVTYALFTGTAMAITALPVAAKTLRDLQLFKTQLGVIVISAAVFDDILGWSLFAITLSVHQGDSSDNGLGIYGSIFLSIFYVIFILTIGNWVTNRIFPYIQAYTSFPSGELGFICFFAFASCTFAIWVGLHNTLGAFIVGAAVGNSRHFREEMRETLDVFVTFMLAPIFFGSVCITADFVRDWDSIVVFTVFFVSCVGKLVGGFVGSKIARSETREAVAIATCMNARGAMELILANVALSAGIIDGKMFVALVFTAIVTSLLPGPMLRYILKRTSATLIYDITYRNGFQPQLQGKDNTSRGFVEELLFLAKAPNQGFIADEIMEKEKARITPNLNNTAILSVVTKHCKYPMAMFGIIRDGFIFHENDCLPTKFLFILLIPEKKAKIEGYLVEEGESFFESVVFREELMKCMKYTELIALLQIQKFRSGMAGFNIHSQAPVKVQPNFIVPPGDGGGAGVMDGPIQPNSIDPENPGSSFRTSPKANSTPALLPTLQLETTTSFLQPIDTDESLRQEEIERQRELTKIHLKITTPRPLDLIRKMSSPSGGPNAASGEIPMLDKLDNNSSFSNNDNEGSTKRRMTADSNSEPSLKRLGSGVEGEDGSSRRLGGRGSNLGDDETIRRDSATSQPLIDLDHTSRNSTLQRLDSVQEENSMLNGDNPFLPMSTPPPPPISPDQHQDDAMNLNGATNTQGLDNPFLDSNSESKDKNVPQNPF